MANQFTNTVIKGLKALGVSVLPMISTYFLSQIKDPANQRDLRDWIARLVKQRGLSADEILQTIDVIREQIGLLAESADDEEEERRARRWGKQLDGFEIGAKMLQTPGAPTRDLKVLRKKVNALRTAVLKALIVEMAEDETVARQAHRGN